MQCGLDVKKRNMLSPPEAAARSCEDGLYVTVYQIRQWAKQGVLPHVNCGRKVLIYYPNLVKFLTGSKPQNRNGYTSDWDDEPDGIADYGNLWSY